MPKKEALTAKEKELAKTLSADGMSFFSIAKRLSRSPHTIAKFLKQPEQQVEVLKIKEELGDMYEDLSRRFITSITDMDISKVNAYQRTLASAVSVDKMRILRGQSTTNVAISLLMSSNIEDL